MRGFFVNIGIYQLVFTIIIKNNSKFTQMGFEECDDFNKNYLLANQLNSKKWENVY